MAITLHSFAAVQLNEPTAYSPYAKILTYELEWKNDELALSYHKKARDAGDISAYYNIGLLHYGGNPEESSRNLQIFLEKAKDAPEYGNDQARFGYIDSSDEAFAQEYLFYLTSDPYKEEMYNPKLAKECALGVAHGDDGPYSEDFQSKITGFASHLYRTDQDDDSGFRILLEYTNETLLEHTNCIHPDFAQSKPTYFQKRRKEMLEHLRQVNAENDGVIDQLLTQDTEGEFDIIKNAYFDEPGTSEPAPEDRPEL